MYRGGDAPPALEFPLGVLRNAGGEFEGNGVLAGGSGNALCCIQLLSRVRFFAILWTIARQAPLSVGILQARVLEWVAISFSRRSSQPRDQTQVSCIAGRFFT